ncbi:MAG: hypothetical protein IJ640_10470 [Prevotella sp.]|nr:hypothetical protein [Prevotella sp.]
MDRTILFRGKAILSREYVYGDLLMHRAPMEICVDNNTVVQVERGTISQYTGFRDKEDYFIFDRDILAVDGEKKPVLIEYIQTWGGHYIVPINEVGMIERGKRITIKTALRNGFDFTKTRVVGTKDDMEEALKKFDIWLGQQEILESE